MKIIRFFRLPYRYTTIPIDIISLSGTVERQYQVAKIGEIALNEQDLAEKLNGDMAEIHMPAKPWYIQLWRFFFPLQGIEMSIHHEEGE